MIYLSKYYSIVLVFCLMPLLGQAQTIHIGIGFTYSNIDQAAIDAQPGDTLLVHEGIYNGGIHIQNLKGTANDWITIKASENEEAIFEGGTNVQFSDAEYLVIEGLIFQGQTGNGLNIDDAGTIETPTHHIHIIDCIFRNINANGNNDFLKLSGLDSFIISSCQFINGAEGGSGIDMVGCHQGHIHDNSFENMGSNSIQAKGGTQFIRIERNRFKDGGLRNINLGGSTGLQFFRPLDAPFEAADLKVYANVFIGGWAGLAYVGSTRVDVANNTFIMPENWVFRILQETVDPSRFISCGDNLFRNNIIYYGDVHRDLNIGPNTRPESFIMNNNLWFKTTDPNFSGPELPVSETNSIYQQDPLFGGSPNQEYRILPHSPAVDAGEIIDDLFIDIIWNSYTSPPSIGAYEGNILYDTDDLFISQSTIIVYPNPATNSITVQSTEGRLQIDRLFIANTLGELIDDIELQLVENKHQLNLQFDLPAGKYYVLAQSSNTFKAIGQFIVINH